MNKSDLITEVANKAGVTKKVADATISSFIEIIGETLANGDKIQMVGFGTFDVRQRAERKGRNPQTNEIIKIPASKAPVFKAGKALKETVNRK